MGNSSSSTLYYGLPSGMLVSLVSLFKSWHEQARLGQHYTCSYAQWYCNKYQLLWNAHTVLEHERTSVTSIFIFTHFRPFLLFLMRVTIVTLTVLVLALSFLRCLNILCLQYNQGSSRVSLVIAPDGICLYTPLTQKFNDLLVVFTVLLNLRAT